MVLVAVVVLEAAVRGRRVRGVSRERRREGCYGGAVVGLVVCYDGHVVVVEMVAVKQQSQVETGLKSCW